MNPETATEPVHIANTGVRNTHLEQRLKAQWAALKDLTGDRSRNSFDKAGVTFVRDGRFSAVIKDEVIVAYLTPVFSKSELVKALVSNIQSDAEDVALILTEAYKRLNIPEGYTRKFDPKSDIRWIENGGNYLSFGSALMGENAENDPHQISTELRVFLDEPRSILFIDQGPRWAGQNVSVIDREDAFPKAATYQELADKIVAIYNEAIEKNLHVAVEQDALGQSKQTGEIPEQRLRPACDSANKPKKPKVSSVPRM